MTTKKDYKVFYEITALDMDSGESWVVARRADQDDAAAYIEVLRKKRKKGDRVIHGMKRRIK